MITIGRKWPRSAPRGDAPRRCDYCGVPWRRSLLTKDAAGFYACPDDRKGRDVVTLSKLNAEAARRPQAVYPKNEGTGLDTESPAIPIPPYTPNP